MQPKHALKLENLGLNYGLKKILENISFTLDFGECLCVLGNNGVGKSSLAKLIMGEEKKSCGVLEIGGLIGYMRQNYFSNYRYPCIDIVLMGLGKSVKLFSHPSKEDRTKAMELLSHLKIAHLADQDFSSLSGGQKQLVLIARLLIGDFDVLILDEITSALDYAYAQLILRLVCELLERKKAVVFITHDINQAFLLKAKILLLSPLKAVLCDYKDAHEDDFKDAFGLPFYRLQGKDGDLLMPGFSL